MRLHFARQTAPCISLTAPAWATFTAWPSWRTGAPQVMLAEHSTLQEFPPNSACYEQKSDFPVISCWCGRLLSLLPSLTFLQIL